MSINISKDKCNHRIKCYSDDTQLQSEYVHVCTCWGNVLDFVWNGMDINPFDGYYEPKKHFHKKYPRITNLFGQKEDKDAYRISSKEHKKYESVVSIK